ncbi:MAG: hypothetical protein F6K24_43745, partial [Okeania sp. SIO2D1]|nr:hypothetical protein [Okeania sp. SIO2D1]
MTYLNGKSTNNSQNINNNQSVELNTEAVEQLIRLLNLLADLNLVDLTEESITSQEDINFQETTEVYPTENNQNLFHQSITKEIEQNQHNVIDFHTELFQIKLIEEFINSQEDINFQEITEVYPTENNHNNSIYQGIAAEPEPNQHNVINFQESITSKEDINFQEITEVHPTENNHNNSIYQGIAAEPEPNQHNVINFQESITSKEDINFQ